MPLLALSNELLNAIIEFCEFSDARELCKTCHVLNTLATPYLYSTITFDDKSEDISSKYPCHYLFLRTIVDRPDLAKFPKIFKCVWLLRPDHKKLQKILPRKLNDINNPAPSLWDLIRIKVNEASTSNKQATLWHKAIFGLRYSRAPGSDGILAFIVSLLSSLEEIYMFEGNIKRGGNAGFDPTAEFFAPLFAHAVALQTKQRASDHEISPYSMSKLASMSIKNDSCNDVPLSKVVHRLELPSLKKLVVQGANDPSPVAHSSIPEIFTSQVEDLQFERSVLRTENLARLLSACPSLRRFSVEHSTDTVRFCSIEMIEGLMASRKTLDSIEAFIASKYVCGRLLSWGKFGRPGSFANFPKLKEIVVSAGFILDDLSSLYTPVEMDSEDNSHSDHIRAFLQRIPRSLQSLTLKDCYCFSHRVQWAVMNLIREKERYAPDLKYISLTFTGVYDTYHGPSEDELFEACKEKGIELGYSPTLRCGIGN
ncbi:hypothetical protein EAE96_003551 [Botrytis aclada]|nr:hypothetical protein EAE96_003551 [Botrytis aclada]